MIQNKFSNFKGKFIRKFKFGPFPAAQSNQKKKKIERNSKLHFLPHVLKKKMFFLGKHNFS